MPFFFLSSSLIKRDLKQDRDGYRWRHENEREREAYMLGALWLENSQWNMMILRRELGVYSGLE